MNYLVSINKKTISGTINLPSSKSISNRIMIISALTKNPLPIHNLSDSDDTLVMLEAFQPENYKIDIGHAGTAMRFLTAYLAAKEGVWELTGSDRMKERPIGILVEALRELGALIEYTEKKGFPPLLIKGTHLTGKAIELDGSVSSQYISALLMIAPAVEGGLTLKLKNEVTSKAYIDLTLKLMNHFGIQYEWVGSQIRIAERAYKPTEFTVEADWSGASYWYEILALAGDGEIFLENLRLESLQGDARIAGWFTQFGISSEQKESGVLLSKIGSFQPGILILDFIENPDIAQTMACICVVRGIPFHFYGLKTLKIKETDRITALQNELSKFGANLTEPAQGELAWDGTTDHASKQTIPVISTYHDHRMALAFAPMALVGVRLRIDDPMVVTKSYPGFWSDLIKVGFTIE